MLQAAEIVLLLLPRRGILFFVPNQFNLVKLYTQMGFFLCSVSFGRSIQSSERVVSGIIRKSVQRRMHIALYNLLSIF